MYQFMVGFKFTQHVCPGRGDHRRRLYQRACPDRMYAPGQGDHWHQKYQSSLFDLCPHCCLPRLIAMMPPLLVLSERCGALNSAALHGIRLHSCPSIWFITHNPFPFFTAHCTLLDTCFGMHFWIPGYAFLPKPCVHVDVPFQITFCSDVFAGRFLRECRAALTCYCEHVLWAKFLFADEHCLNHACWRV